MKTIVLDLLGSVVVLWSIPLAILLVGTPIVMLVALVVSFARWVAQA